MPTREETQRKLDLRSAAASRIKPADAYTVADRFEAQVAEYGDKDFLVYRGRHFSYREVDERANQYARVFAVRGIGVGDVCAMAMENRPDFFFCWLGLTKLGAITAFLNYNLSGRPLVHALQSTRAKAVVVGEECISVFADTDGAADFTSWLVPDAEKPAEAPLPAHLDQTFYAEVLAADTTAPDASVRAGVKAEDDMLYIFTSGTTGLPKAAKYSHMRWMSSGDVMNVTLEVTPADVFYCCLPLYHGAAATSVTSTALTSGSSIVVRRKFSASEFWSDVRQNQVSIFQYIGEICRYLLNKPEQANDREHSLRCMLGAGLSPEIWRRWLERFGAIEVFEGWGATEANAAVLNVDNHLGSCGRIPFWDKTNLRLLRFDPETGCHARDKNGRYVHCEPGEIGEAVGYIVDHPEIGAGRFEGYTSPEATESKILRNVFQDGDAWWASGDLLRYDEDGYCYFVDRIGDTFRWKSENVSTQEVSDALGDFPGMELINVYGVLVPEHEGRAGMAAILMQPGQAFDPKAFYQHVEQRVPHYAVPVFVRVSSQADLTTTFKLRKIELQRQGYDPALVGEPLFIRDVDQQTYVPYSVEALERNGLPAFAGASA
ncbi:long-chain-acyl-CoA synthetase [Pseudomonas saliphila]|uniref:long-chain-acyl-CoA synthetase n=1 Tax=Pseudomonas saliphila TaxID=2586906 RepID=UPI001F2CD79B|nr:long-chain-acyl-CoA synthetase [Pseudomonas saliphila]